MQLATVRDGKPWVCTVNYAIDDKNNLFWLSLRTRRHSRELQNNPVTAAAIVKDPAVKRGLQLEGRAGVVSEVDLERAHALYTARYGDKPERLAEASSGEEHTHTYYIFTPSHIKLHDEVNFPDDPQQEITLEATRP